MPGVLHKIFSALVQLIILPVYGVAWLVGSPYLMTMLCIMSEVLVELVVSTVMAGVSLIVSAVILIEEDPRSLNGGPSKHLNSLYDRKDSLKKKHKGSSTNSLEKLLRSDTKIKSISVPETKEDSFFETNAEEDGKPEEKTVEGKETSTKEQLSGESLTPGDLEGKDASQKSLEGKLASQKSLEGKVASQKSLEGKVGGSKTGSLGSATSQKRPSNASQTLQPTIE